MNRFIVLITILLFVISCNSSKQKEREWLQNYTNVLLNYNPELVSHFPNDLTHFERRKLYYYPPNSVKQTGFTGIILDCWADSAYFYKNFNQIKSRNIKSVSINNNSLTFIGSDTIPSCLGCYPIISFSDVKDQFGIKNKKLNQREEIFFTEISQESFLDDNKDKKEEWDHGMSRGIVFDREELRMLYWLVVW